MKVRMRAVRPSVVSTTAAFVVLGASIILGALPLAAADTTIRFCNGREVVAHEYWFAGDRLMFSRAQGTVGVPRSFVAALIDTPSTAKIGAAPPAVNASRCLSAPSRSVTLSAAVPSKEDLYDRAVDLVAEGLHDEAISMYKEALALDPAFADAIHGLAMAYADKGMFEEAIEYGRRLVELTPDDTLAHTSLSMFYQRRGMIQEAEAEGAKARMLDWKRQLAEQKKESGGS